MQGDREKALEAGMDDYISKPIDMETLDEMLKHWISPPHPKEAEPNAIAPDADDNLEELQDPGD